MHSFIHCERGSMIKLKFAEHRSALTVKAIACKIQTTVHLKQLVRSNCSCMLLTHSYNSLCKFLSWQEHKVKRLQMSRAEKFQFIFHV